MTLSTTENNKLQRAVAATPPLYLLMQRRICVELGVDEDTVGADESPQTMRALRAFEHLAYLWADPAKAPEGRYHKDVHALVWSCALDVYIMEGVPQTDIPVRMRAIASQATGFTR